MTGEITRKSFILAEGYIPCDVFFILNIYIIACFTVKLLSSCASSCSFKMKSSVPCNPIVCRRDGLGKTKTIPQSWRQISTTVNNSDFLVWASLTCGGFCLFCCCWFLRRQLNYCIIFFFFSFLTPVAVPWDSYKCLWSLQQKYILLVNC